MTFADIIFPVVSDCAEPLMVVFTLAVVFDYLRSMLFN